MDEVHLYYNQQISADIYKEIKENPNKVKELDQSDRDTVLTALNNIRYAHDPDRVREILTGNAGKILKRLKSLEGQDLNHVRSSGFFARLVKGILNLFGRTSSATIRDSVSNLNPRIQQQLEEMRAKLKKAEEVYDPACPDANDSVNNSLLGYILDLKRSILSLEGVNSVLSKPDSSNK